jgi:hypothetical protein
LIITTHSPYIFTALNNLIYAHQIAHQKNLQEEVEKIIDKNFWIDPKRVGVYFVDKGQIENIFDAEAGLMEVERIDSASELIYDKYSQLSNLKWAE